MPAAHYELFLAADADMTGLNLLAHEDIALKAYFETRSRYLADLPPNMAFNQIGEALPTVLLDGRVQGTWTWDPTALAVRPTLAPGRASRGLARRLSSAAEALRSGWRGRPARPDPNQLTLAY
ncbi:hypothetical protein [Frankia sp. Cr1]|uniref:hypothetical protein n=1 Tax=Frankia sp. Cr1 TaxID=3073931 RepID=UPI002AD3F769|nr:hypothetical protein [Frankia sp. Cr1]